MYRFLLGLALVLTLGACADGLRNLETKPVDPLGNFKLGHSGVVAPNLVMGPLSREATKEEWVAAMEKAVDDRFKRQKGDKYYHLGVSVEGYVLAQPGIPLVFSPKSALIIRVTVWDDAAQKKLNEEPEQITVLESFSAETVVGSGLTQSKEVQMEKLAANASLQIETWLRRMMRDEGWFGGDAANAATEDTAEKAAQETAKEAAE